MSKRKYINLAAAVLMAIGGAGLLAAALALSGRLELQPEDRRQIVFFGSLTVLSAYAGLMLLGWARREQRRRAWRRGMAIWKRCADDDHPSALARVAAAAHSEREAETERLGEAQAGKAVDRGMGSGAAAMPPEKDWTDLEGLTGDELRRLAGQAFERMGYEPVGGEKRPGWLRLSNPLGEIEVAALLAGGLADAGLVVEMQEEMHRVGAVYGFIWSPGGFTEGARRWGKNRPIRLADGRAIGRFIDCAKLVVEREIGGKPEEGRRVAGRGSEKVQKQPS